jgi:hypothetical protein
LDTLNAVPIHFKAQGVTGSVAASGLDSGDVGTRPGQRNPRRALADGISASLLPLVMAVLALALVSTGYGVFKHEKEGIKRQEQDELAAIANLKVRQIAQWIAERRGDAYAFGRDSVLAAAIREWLRHGGPADDARRRILARMRTLKEAYGYRSVLLVDGGGMVRLSTEASPLVTPQVPAMALDALRKQMPVLSDLHRLNDASGKIRHYWKLKNVLYLVANFVIFNR